MHDTTDLPDTTSISNSRRQGLIRYGALFVVMLISYGYLVQGLGPNELSRYNLVRAVVDDRSLIIDKYRDNTMDKAYYNGHYYSDKAFGLSFMAAPVYAAVRAIDSLHTTEKRNDFGMVYFLVLFTVAVPSAVTVLLIARLARRLMPDGSPLFAALVYGFGTIAFPFATSFFGHQPAAFLGFAAACLAIYTRLEKKGPLWSLGSGVLAGLTLIVEYPAAIVGVMLFFYIALVTRDWRHIGAYAAGMIPALLALAGYNYLAFGNPISISYGFVNDPAFAAGKRGIMGVTLPDLETAFTLLFGGRGLLVNSPVLVLVPYGLYRMWKAKRARAEAALCLAVVIGFFGYNSGFWLPFGGMSPGPRFLLAAFPFLTLPLSAAVGKTSEHRLFAWALAGWGMAVMSVAAITGPLVNEGKAYPLVDAWIPNLLGQRFVYNIGKWFLHLEGPGSLVPLLIAAALGLLIVWFVKEPPARTAENEPVVGQPGCASQT